MKPRLQCSLFIWISCVIIWPIMACADDEFMLYEQFTKSCRSEDWELASKLEKQILAEIDAPSEISVRSLFGNEYARSGRQSDAVRVVSEGLERSEFPSKRARYCLAMSQVFILSGDCDSAMLWIDKAESQSEGLLPDVEARVCQARAYVKGLDCWKSNIDTAEKMID